MFLFFSCAMKCFEKFTEAERKRIFEKFYSHFKTKNEQDMYLQSLISVTNVSTRRKRFENGKERNQSYHYAPNSKNDKIKICQNAFLSLHGVSIKRVKRLKSLLLKGSTPRDKRGKCLKTHAISDAENTLIRLHVSSFPVKETHYSGRDYRYLDCRLNVKIMYNMFKEKHPSTKVKYSYYIKFFHENFDLHFGRPQIDTCCQCEEFSLKIKSPSLGEAAKLAAVAEKMIHERRARKFYTALKNTVAEVAETDSITAITFDFMQNLQLPRIPVQDAFYLTQLSVSVFGIHDLKTGKAYYYVYHEGLAAKTPDEVCSFLMDYINNYADPGSKELRLFSDNCPGQNKNHTLVRFCMGLTQTGRFNKVQQYFPIRGHSFLPCDRDFGAIKRYLKKFDRIYSVHQYTEKIIQSSQKNKFVVKEVSTQDIMDWKKWWPKYYKKTSASTDSLKKGIPRNQKVYFTISKYHHILHNKDMPGIVEAREFVNGFVVHHFDLAQPNKRHNVSMPLQKAYTGDKIPILDTEIEHLKQLIKWVDEDNIPFYQNLIDTWDKKSRKDKGSAKGPNT